jgi:hypothetical protein
MKIVLSKKTTGSGSLVFFLGAFLALLFFAESPQVQAATTYPSQVLDLANWKVTLPTGKSSSPTEFLQPALATCTVDPYFHANATADAVVFRAPVNGVTTSNSGYPRSELREMKNGGADNASWSTTSGTHTMFIDGAITAVPKTKKHIVFGQIHDANDDVIVIRLEYPKLFVDINGKTGPTLDAKYTLGKRFNVKFVAEGGKISIYYNGNQTASYSMSKSTSGCYFKAGAYTQSNCSKESDCSSNNFGEVVIYKLALNGQVVIPPTPPVTPPVAPPVTPPVTPPAITPSPVVIDGTVPFEAESGVASGGMRVLTDDATASGGKYVKANSSGSVNYQFKIPVAGTYRLAGWIKTLNGSSDSFSFSLDGKSSVTWTLAYPKLSWTYDVDDGHTFPLTIGTHTLSLKYREIGAKIDKIVLIKQ